MVSINSYHYIGEDDWEEDAWDDDDDDEGGVSHLFVL